MEHRQGSRRYLGLEVTIHHPLRGPMRAELCDISGDGLFLRCPELMADSRMVLDIDLPLCVGPKPAPRLRVAVVRRSGDGVGVLLSALDEATASALALLMSGVEIGEEIGENQRGELRTGLRPAQRGDSSPRK